MRDGFSKLPVTVASIWKIRRKMINDFSSDLQQQQQQQQTKGSGITRIQNMPLLKLLLTKLVGYKLVLANKVLDAAPK
ncbi:GH13405 [Drosophila grimshawi]|uniref:GH13405 n=1 Tax=Drosophila grimshawi TaxID=7222 RepID=B4JPG5_DROGR|nr:GH13405 [Drosophila grimshawi]